MLRRALALSLLALPALGAQNAAAPSGRCRFVFDNTPSTRLSGTKLPSGQYNNFIGGGVVARCPAQHIVLRSDSLEAFGDEGRLYFVGHVDYVEPRLALKSDFLTYFQRDERLLATQNVDARLPSGSTIKGPQLEYFRPVPRTRPQQSATAPGRPTINLIEKDSKGTPQPPVKVTGNTVWLLGDSIVSSSGNVVVVRPELTATGDSLFADAGPGLLRLMRAPKVVGTKGRPFTLIGETIDLLTRQRKVERVLSKNGAEATSDDLYLKSDTIDMRVSNDLLQRAYAWGRSRAHARSQSQSIVSDSIEVVMPDQRVREMHALRLASADGTPDTTKFRTTEKDRLTGDTIIARFDTIPVKDTLSRQRMKEITAVGHATSLQHLAPRDTSCRVPAVNYVRGRLIRVTFVAGKIDSVQVNDPDQAGGVHTEPKCEPPPKALATPATGVPAARPATGTPAPGAPAKSPPAAPAAPSKGVAQDPKKP
jgi:hypothetical protein